MGCAVRTLRTQEHIMLWGCTLNDIEYKLVSYSSTQILTVMDYIIGVALSGSVVIEYRLRIVEQMTTDVRMLHCHDDNIRQSNETREYSEFTNLEEDSLSSRRTEQAECRLDVSVGVVVVGEQSRVGSVRGIVRYISVGVILRKPRSISDLKVKEEKDIDKMIEMDKKLKFLNEIVYTRNQSIQTIHMLAPKCSTYNGRPTFANPRYLKKAQSDKPCLYEIPYDTSDLANRFVPNREETMTLANESRSKLNKDYVKPLWITQNKIFFMKFSHSPSMEYLYQLERAKRIREDNVEKTVC
ncbi:hypothetical protein Tco_1081623 [Tanacetum coccineum]|uniref:Uncharacterized protein n=1 Tax=Tanacetum coccineum TaxID=301880 RepID=A0ABQ5HY77_9ASTR